MSARPILSSSTVTTRRTSDRATIVALVFSDAVSLLLAFVFAAWITGAGTLCRPGIHCHSSGESLIFKNCLLAALGISWFAVKLRHYTFRRSFWTELREILIVIIALAVVDLALDGLGRWTTSRVLWSVSWACAALLLPICRTFTKVALNSFGIWKKPTFIIGTTENAVEACLALNSDFHLGFNPVAFVLPEIGEAQSPKLSLPVLTSVTTQALRALPSAHIVIALEHDQRGLRDRWIRDLTQAGMRDVSVIPAMRGVPLYGTDISYFLSHEVILLRLRHNLTRLPARFIKRAMDIVVSACLLVIFMPLLLTLAAVVKSDGGPAFFGHMRLGLGGKKFPCYKFRSMVPNASELLKEILAKDPIARAEWEKDFKLKNDIRITQIGKFLRKTSLDELPQLWNVFMGHMSLVGPRPIVESELERYKEDADYYLMAKPGMTGLWQVSGRNDTDYATRVYLDAWYVKNWSLWYDISILCKTAGVMIRPKGAY